MIPAWDGCGKLDSGEPVWKERKRKGAPASAPLRASLAVPIASSRRSRHMHRAVAPSSRGPTQHVVVAAPGIGQKPRRKRRGASDNTRASIRIAAQARPQVHHAGAAVAQRESLSAQKVSASSLKSQTRLPRDSFSLATSESIPSVVTQNFRRGCAQLFCKGYSGRIVKM